MKISNNIPLLIGVALPIIFICIISVVIFAPSFMIKPQYNFVYSDDRSDYDYNQNYAGTYVVIDGHVVLKPRATTTGVVYKDGNPPLFLYDVKNNSSHQITYEEAQKLSIDPGPSSSDGYIVKYQNEHDGIFELFGSNGSQNGYVVSKGNSSKKLTGLGTNGYNYYSNSLKFLGWVK